MNRRQMDILGRIIEDPKFYKVSKLAQITNMSSRTIYNDLVDIHDHFLRQGLDIITFNDNGCIEINEEKELNEFLLDKIKFDDYELNTEERKSIIICLLLLSTDYITIQSISDLIYCSRSTIMKDIKKIKDEIKKDKIILISHPNKGYIVQGEEIDIRDKFIEICMKNIFIIKIFFRDKIENKFNLSKTSLDKINRIVLREMIKNKFSLTDDSLYVLEYYLFFSIKRIELGNYIEEYKAKNKNYYELVKNMFFNIEELKEEKDIESEISYLSELMGNLHFSKKIDIEVSLVTIQLLVRIFIEEMSSTLNIDLFLDKDLFSNLSNHMIDILNKKSPEIYETNELTYYVEKNKDIISLIKENIYVFENYISRALTETEIAYLGLHISASLEKFKIINRDLRVLIICNSGVGTVQLLKARLARTYSFTIVDTVSVFQLSSYDLSNIDLIISTVYLNNMVDKPNVSVSVNLNDKDMEKINSVISLISDNTLLLNKSEVDKQEVLIRKIAPLVDKYDGLLELVQNTINNYFTSRKATNVGSLSSFLTEEMITLNVDAADWEEAIHRSVVAFNNNSMVTEQFEKEIINSIKNYGSYIVISEGVAFPHAGFDQGAIKTGFTFTRLKKPIILGENSTSSVDLIFGLSAADNKTHLDALFSLIELVNNIEFKEELRKAKTKEEVINCIKKYEGI